MAQRTNLVVMPLVTDNLCTFFIEDWLSRLRLGPHDYVPISSRSTNNFNPIDKRHSQYLIFFTVHERVLTLDSERSPVDSPQLRRAVLTGTQKEIRRLNLLTSSSGRHLRTEQTNIEASLLMTQNRLGQLHLANRDSAGGHIP